jgi:hypothetical protein
LKGISKLTWQTFFRVCTEEVDDLSMRAVKLVIEYFTLSTSQTALENYE